MERSTVLGCTTPCHLAQGERGRWPVGCLFPTFTSGAKLQLLRPNQRIRRNSNPEAAGS